MKLRTRILLFGLLLLNQSLWGQWGSVLPNMVRMEDQDQWPEEDAVVLQHTGNLYVANDGTLTTNHYLRIKIFTQAGSEYGTLEFPFVHAADREDIYQFRGQIHYTDESDEVQTERLDNVFKEKVNDYVSVTRAVFAKVQPGAILEIEYKHRSNYLFNYQWDFQTDLINHEDLPVAYSEFTANFFEEVAYAFVYEGNAQQKLNKLGNPESYHWVMRDLPALREEPYIRNIEDYRSKMLMQMTAYFSRSQGRVVETMGKWEDLTRDVIRENRLGRYDRKHKATKGLVERLAPANLESRKRVERIHQHVAQEMEWNGRFGIFTKEPIGKLYEGRTAHSGEVNLVLLHLLIQAGIEAYPVLVSTRSNGQPVKVYPIFDQFDALIVLAKVDGKELFLDATNSLLPIDFLPQAYLGVEGWKLDIKNPGWVQVSTPPISSNEIFLQLSIKEDGSISGTYKNTTTGYAAEKQRRLFLSSGKEEFRKVQLADLFNEVNIENLELKEVENLDEPLVVTCSFSTTDFVRKAGDRMYLDPFLGWGPSENPFTQASRSYPIDFGAAYQRNVWVMYQIPQGWSLDEKPESIKVTMPSKTLSFLYGSELSGPFLNMQSKYQLNQSRFDAREYDGLRELYSKMSQVHAEPVVLKKDSVEGDSE